MTGEPRLPHFLLIGAIKAATTWVAWELQQHPDIFLPGPEPHYFTREFHRGPDWYSSFFAEAAPTQLRGEKTADYLANPDAAARIAAVLPDVPMIVQLRDPVERAYSDYCMLLRRGSVSDKPEEYLDPASATFRRFIDNGLYFSHLRRWFDLFDRDQFLIFLYDDVKARPLEVIDRCYRHIGVSPPHDGPAAPAGRINDGSVSYLPLPIRRALAPIKPLVMPLRRRRGFEQFRSMFARPIRYPPMTRDLRARLRDFYEPEIAGLAKLLGRNLDSWLTGAANCDRVEQMEPLPIGRKGPARA
jgi:hypothetical protein